MTRTYIRDFHGDDLDQVLRLGGVGVLAAAGALLTVAAVLIPTLSRLRTPVAAALGAV
ncbi:MAG: hypothetical protein JST33_07355 [Actinobacteria bacterium]|nr:hypothetical protein [Actinomycetota bacterium]